MISVACYIALKTSLLQLSSIKMNRCALLLAEEQVDGRAVQVPVLADLVLEIALVRVLDPLRQVAEEDERGNVGALEHRDVLDLDVLALDGGRRERLDGGLHHVVEL